MRQIILVLILGFSAGCWAVNGDMGGGDGSADNPYLIEDVNDFDAFAGNPVYWAAGVHTQLMDDIDLWGRRYTAAVIAPDTDTMNQQFDGPPYEGIFNGDSFDILNLLIDTIGDDNHYLGLFGRIDGTAAEVRNVEIEDATVTGGNRSEHVGALAGDNGGTVRNCSMSSSVTVSGGAAVGGLVGTNRGDVINCFTNDTVVVIGDSAVGGLVGTNDFSGNVTLCDAIWQDFGTCTVNALGFGAGGLAGSNAGIVTHCTSYSDVMSLGDYTGGLAGTNSGSIASCYAAGDVDGAERVGGLVGYNGRVIGLTGTYSEGGVTNCYAAGSVSGSKFVGGLAGLNESVNVTNCYAASAVSGTGGFVGGFIGSSNAAAANSFWDVAASGMGSAGDDNFGATGKTTAQMESQSTFTNAGWDFADETANGTSQVWEIYPFGGYPVLVRYMGSYPVELAGDGSPVNPYRISNAAELGMVYHYRSNACYRLAADIDASGIRWSTAVLPGFYGVLDGAGHTISHLTIDGGGNLGLLGIVGNSGVDAAVVDLGLEAVSIRGAGGNVGSLAGYNGGSISGCYAVGDVDGSGYGVGGLVGQSTGEIRDCYSSGVVNGDIIVGGLAAANYGMMTNCYSTCAVSGSSSVGGLIGIGQTPAGGAGSVADSFWDIETSGTNDGVGDQEPDPDGVTGLHTAPMQMLSTFIDSGWDFDAGDGDAADWMMLREGEDYPRLAWQAVFAGDIAGLYGVDMVDAAYLGRYWGLDDCDGVDDCGRADIDLSGDVGIGDLAAVAEDWLK